MDPTQALHLKNFVATKATIRWSLPMNSPLPKHRSIETRCRENQLYPHLKRLHRSQIISRYSRLISRDRKGPLSLLERLPVELLHYISSYLPTSSTACLTLCSHYLLYALGTQHWERLRAEDDEREAFLGFFEKEFPHHWLCHRCAIFHRIMPTDKDPWPWNINERGCILSEPPLSGTYFYVRHRTVELAMKRHFYGAAHGVPLSVFSWPFENFAHRQINTTARIIGDNFYLRWHYRFEEPLRFWSTFARERVLPLLCHHIDLTEGYKKIRTLLACKLQHMGVKDCLHCMMYMHCPRCPTEYELGASKLKHGVKVLEFTTWKNLGSGRTPRDPNWEMHISTEPEATDESIPRSVRSTFESQQLSGGGLKSWMTWLRDGSK